ncbi:MAG: tRNA lysidine(34) synthetase TilS [Spirochaetales bacterium]|nr:tRNA lysidine(34) synthetase TilS [Spirochaetales bacterium]
MKSTRKIIEEAVNNYLIEYQIQEKAVIIAAFSGGSDSTALVSILSGMKGAKLKIICAYYNHNLRNGSKLECELEIVRKFADANGLILKTGCAGAGVIEDYASKHNQSIEEAARNKRYEFLEKVRLECCADYIATGHHLDDNAETVLMRFLQNSGVAGLSGIPRQRDKIIRPLIEVPKKLLDDLIKEEGMSCSRDETNDQQIFLRNRLRHVLIPSIREIFPEFDHNMSGLSEKVRMYNSFINEEAEKRLNWTEIDGGWKLSSKKLFEQHLLLRIHSVYGRINRLQNEKQRIKFHALERALSGDGVQNGKVLFKTGKFEVISRNDCILVRSLVNHTKKSYLLSLQPDIKYKVHGQIFQIFYESGEVQPGGEQVSIAVISPLIARSFREGDWIRMKDGSKSVKKLLSEWKVCTDDRQLIPIVEDTDGIAAVIGSHLGYEDKTAYGRNITGKKQKRVLLRFNTVTETTSE